MPKVKPPHHRGTHQARAKAVTDAAYADPETRCWRCRRTLAQIRRHKPKAIWHGGHVVDGEVGGLLLAECSTCNSARGARMGNLRRAATKRRRTALSW